MEAEEHLYASSPNIRLKGVQKTKCISDLDL